MRMGKPRGSSLTYFGPKIDALATQSLAQYAVDLLNHQQQQQEEQASHQPPPLQQPLFHSQYKIDDWNEVFHETSDYFFAKTKTPGWKVAAHAAKFERTLNEKYGRWRPFVRDHPEIEVFLKLLQRKYNAGELFSIFQKPPIPRSTSVILLFMMQRGKMNPVVLLLSVLFFLVGLQPWVLVLMVVVFRSVAGVRRNKALGKMKDHIEVGDPYYAGKDKAQLLKQPVGTPIDTVKSLDTNDYDTILFGHGPHTLYTAALLGRAGRKVLVLSGRTDASGCLTFSNANQLFQTVPFDVDNCSTTKVVRQQELLAPALATNTDCQGGIRFAKVGSPLDGYAYEILAIPGMGTDGADQSIPFVLKASGGVQALMEDAANYLGDNWPEEGKSLKECASLTGQYIAACDKINRGSGSYYGSKILSEGAMKMQSDNEYKSAALRDTETMLNAAFPTNSHLRSLMAGIGMKRENLRPSATCLAAHVSNLSGLMNEEGLHYPVGGPRALCHALANTIEQCGGRVVTDAQVIELLFDESIKVPPPMPDPKAEGPAPPCCVGVQLAGGKEIRFDAGRYKETSSIPLVISNQGFINTFIRLLPDDIRTTYKVPRGVPALVERRPVVHFLFALKGSARDLDVTGADYYRLPGCALARDEVNQETGSVHFGEIGWSDEARHSSGNADDVNQERKTTEERRGKTTKRAVKFEAGTSWMEISFPSAKDPSFEEHHGKITTCVVTIEADDSLVTPYDTKPKIFVVKNQKTIPADEMQRLSERVKKDLFSVYPQLEGKIQHAEIRGPFPKGLSHVPERFAAKGVRSDTPYPGLYAGGSDLTIGDSFSGGIVGGWLVANAVCGYNTFVDFVMLRKTITNDLAKFLEKPDVAEDEDVAVPYSCASVDTEGDDSYDAEQEFD